MSSMRRVSYGNRRRAIWEVSAKDLDTLAGIDLLSDLGRPNLIPDARVEDRSLFPALDCLYANDREHGTAFCRRAVEVANRIVADDRCRANAVCEAAYPHNLGVVLRGRTYADWLLGNPLDDRTMRAVAEHLAIWCLTKALDHKRFHQSMTMNVYLEGVRAAMVARDLDYAANLLETKLELRWHHGMERELWSRLIAVYPDVGRDLRADIESFFDRVRDPDFAEYEDGQTQTFINREILALEAGIIRRMYVINDSALDPVDRKVVIRDVAR